MSERFTVRSELWFEEFTPGLVVETPARTITEADLVAFCGLSGDYTALHSDEEFARRTPFRGRIAHGMLVQAIATGLATRTGVFEGTVQAVTDMTIHWRAPVMPGDTIRLELEVKHVDPEPSRRSGEIGFAARVFNQENKVVCDGEWTTRMMRKDAERQRERVEARARERSAGPGKDA